MISLAERLKSGRLLLGDGAMGTMLQQLGYIDSSCPESLNLTRPDILQQVADSYLEAGAEILQTNTFGGSTIALAKYNLEAQAREINLSAARAVRKAVRGRAYVTGSIGPCGRYLLPFGDLDPAELERSCRIQIHTLADAGVDAFSIETMMDVEEATIVIRTAKKIAPDTIIMASATFNETPKGFYTYFGTPLKEVIFRFQKAGADVTGANCSSGMASIIRIARQFREHTSAPILMRPNAGLPEIRDGNPVWTESPEEFAEGAQELMDLGVNVIGGCCGTTPEHIRQISKIYRDRQVTF